MQGDTGSIFGLGRSAGVGKWQPTPIFLSGKSHGERSLVGYSPQGHKKSGMTEWAHTHTHEDWTLLWVLVNENSIK